MKLSTVKRLHRHYWNKYVIYYSKVFDINNAYDLEALKCINIKGDVEAKCHLCQYSAEQMKKKGGVSPCFNCPAPHENGCVDGLYDKLTDALCKNSRNRHRIVSLCKKIRDIKLEDVRSLE